MSKDVKINNNLHDNVVKTNIIIKIIVKNYCNKNAAVLKQFTDKT